MTELKITIHNDAHPYPCLMFSHPVGLGSSAPDWDAYIDDFNSLLAMFPKMSDPEDITIAIENLLYDIIGDYELDWFGHAEMQLNEFEPGFTQEHVDRIIKELEQFK